MKNSEALIDGWGGGYLLIFKVFCFLPEMFYHLEGIKVTYYPKKFTISSENDMLSSLITSVMWQREIPYVNLT